MERRGTGHASQRSATGVLLTGSIPPIASPALGTSVAPFHPLGVTGASPSSWGPFRLPRNWFHNRKQKSSSQTIENHGRV